MTAYFEMDCPCKGKNLDKMLQPNILMILCARPMYGLEIVNELAKQPIFLGSSPDPTGVYRYLNKMTKSGTLSTTIEKVGGKPLKIYSITEKGRECLLNWDEVLKQYAKCIEYLTDKLERVK